MPVTRRPFRRWCAAPLLLLAAACSDPVLARPAAPSATPVAECRVDVHALRVTCSPLRVSPSTAPGVHAAVIGGQDVYVRLASAGTAYDAAAQVLTTSVTVESLVRQSMGTPDGSTVSGIRVFFQTAPVVTSGTGTVTVANPDGTGTFTGADQPYFEYGQILGPYEISSARTWQFGVPSTVGSFVFRVYVSAELSDSGALLDRVWTGSAGTDWRTPGNWQGGVVPDSTSTVAIPPDSLLASGNHPVLSADVVVANLRVGAGSGLDLAGFTLEARGNVDGAGGVTGGTLRMAGSGSVLGGSVGSLVVTGGTRLQAATRSAGPVAVTGGALAVSGSVLSITAP